MARYGVTGCFCVVGEPARVLRDCACRDVLDAWRLREPAEFAWERGTLQSQQSAPMLEALRLLRPEWYSDRMRVLAVLSWEDAPARPSVLREEAWLAVTWPDRPERPAVGFALAPAEPLQVRPPVEQALGDRPLWLFG